ncbi:MAG: LacI family DNA-binding transcriptional regulator, partial [Actinobacteria bacterium]|nr:LacI family DNA-binding transcriptional regulator [Actinomycetota bacterium]
MLQICSAFFNWRSRVSLEIDHSKIGIKEVAIEAGVSPATVSRA